MSASGLDEAIRRRRNLYLLGAGAFLALETVLVVSSLLMRSHEQVLDRGAVRTEAVVKDSRRYRLRPEGAAVRYEVNGQQIETILTVNRSENFVEGERVTVEYDPRNPRHARPVEGWAPTYEYLLFAAAWVALVLPAIVVQEMWRDLQAARATRADPDIDHALSRVQQVAMAMEASLSRRGVPGGTLADRRTDLRPARDGGGRLGVGRKPHPSWRRDRAREGRVGPAGHTGSRWQVLLAQMESTPNPAGYGAGNRRDRSVSRA